MKITYKLWLLSTFILLFSTNCAYALLDTAINYEKNTIAVFSYGESYASSNGINLYFRCKSKEYFSSKEAYEGCVNKCNDLMKKVKSIEAEITGIQTSDVNLIYKHKKASYKRPGIEEPEPSGDAENKEILCFATQDIKISMPFSQGNYDSVILIEDLMVNGQADPIEPKEYGIKGFGGLSRWLGEKNNIEYILDNKDKLKSDALENAMMKGKKQALEISKNIGKNIVGIHSVQHIDDKDKIMHLWGSFSPSSIDGGMVALDRIKYQVGILLIYTFE